MMGIQERQLAVQLYTLRREMTNDPWGTLDAVQAMGWKAVQVSGFPYQPDVLARELGVRGLAVAGIHLPYDRFAEDLDGVAKEAETLGTVDVVCPSLPEALRSADGFQQARRTLRAASKTLAARGLRLSYHNHDYEFRYTIQGLDGLQYLLAADDEGALEAEFDVYWLAHGEQDPVSFMRPYRGRIPILHLKDMTADDRRTFAEVGAGTLDFPAILQEGAASGVTWYAVEQDRCEGDPLHSLALSRKNLLAMLG